MAKNGPPFFLVFLCGCAAQASTTTLSPGFIPPMSIRTPDLSWVGVQLSGIGSRNNAGSVSSLSLYGGQLERKNVNERDRGHPKWGGTSIRSRGVMKAGVGEDVLEKVEDKIVNDEQKRRDAMKAVLLGVFGEDAGGEASESSPGSSSLAADPVLACPSTLGELTEGFRSYGGVLGGVRYKTSSKRPGVRYRENGVYTDFIEEEKAPWSRNSRESIMEGTFQSPLVSWLYERGWRQGFNANGFPGIDEEFKQVQAFFEGSEGGTIMDLSCGSGLMTRRLAASKRYSRVIGGDLSTTMLDETARRFKQNGLDLPDLIRCDVSKLPVQTESIDGAHAGAALHCWTKLEESVSEVYRVLKPGKGFFATTFLTNATIRTSSRSGFKFFELDELEQLMLSAGFDDVAVTKNGRACAIIRARKAER